MKAAAVEKIPGTELRRLIARHAADHVVSELVKITPEMAADALSQNTINRPVRVRHREFLARQMGEGRWRVTHQGIAFSRTGDLLDGQHRLLAVTDVGKPVEMSVSFNVPREAFYVIDYGSVPRTLSDVTGFDRKVLEPVGFLFREAVGRELRFKFDLDEFAPYWACFGSTAKDLYSFCSVSRRVMSSAPIRAAAVYVAKTSGDDTAPFWAYRSLAMQEYSSMPPSLQALNRQLIDNDIRSGVERFVRAVTAFERQDVGRIQIRDVFAKAAEYRAKIQALAAAHAKQVWKIKNGGGR